MLDSLGKMMDAFCILALGRNDELFCSLSSGSKSYKCFSSLNQNLPLFYRAISPNIYPPDEQLFLLSVYFASLNKQSPVSYKMFISLICLVFQSMFVIFD